MRFYKILFVLLSYLFSSNLGAYYQNAFEIFGAVAYRCESLKWTVKPEPGIVNCFQRAFWKNMRAPEVRGGMAIRPFYDTSSYAELAHLFFEFEGGRVIAASGKDFYGTYIGQAPSEIFATNGKRSSSVQGNDFSVSLGYDIWVNDTILLIPTVGYATESRKLKAHPDHLIGISSATAGVSTLQLSRMHDNNWWHGPWVGLYADITPFCDWKMVVGGEYHYANFHGKAIWTGNEALTDGTTVSTWSRVHQHQYVNEFIGTAALHYTFCDCWKITIGGIYEYFQKNKGSDHLKTAATYTAAGSSNTVENKVNANGTLKWQSIAAYISLNYIF